PDRNSSTTRKPIVWSIALAANPGNCKTDPCRLVRQVNEFGSLQNYSVSTDPCRLVRQVNEFVTLSAVNCFTCRARRQGSRKIDQRTAKPSNFRSCQTSWQGAVNDL